MKTKKEVMTDPLLKKGGAHRIMDVVPEVCTACSGRGSIPQKGGQLPKICIQCGGEGVTYG